MTEKIPVSVFIITKNEADRVPITIASVKDWVEEVIVVDSGSEDGTVEVCKALGARVEYRVWEGYGLQKRFAESLCKCDWVFNLDADEEVTDALRQEIQSLFCGRKQPDVDGYFVRRPLLFAHQKKVPPFAVYDHFLRLYHRNKGGYKDSTVHDSVEMKDGAATSTLKGALIHRCFRSYEHWAEKINFYSSMQARDAVSKGRRVSSLRLLCEPFAAFIKAYLFRRYIFYGVDGVLYSWMYVHARLLRLVKIREHYLMQRLRSS